MGGCGSGRYGGSGRNTVEGCRSIDIRDWRRRGDVPGTRCFGWQWSWDGEKVASIMVCIQGRDGIDLAYRQKGPWDDDWSDVEQHIPVQWTPCHFGGERPWFICAAYRNGVYCGRRVAKLFGAGRLFACRHCYDLAYQSQHESPDGRALLKCQRIRMDLGGSASLFEPFPDKPKGMHWRTYLRHFKEAADAEARSWAGMSRRLGIKV